MNIAAIKQVVGIMFSIRSKDDLCRHKALVMSVVKKDTESLNGSGSI